MKKLLLSATVLILLSACGGPCQYEDRPFKATIVSISDEKSPSPYGYKEGNPEMGYVVKVVTDILGRDTLILHDMVEQTITDEYLEQHRLEVGKVLKGEAHLRTSGSCSPSAFRFADSTLNAH